MPAGFAPPPLLRPGLFLVPRRIIHPEFQLSRSSLSKIEGAIPDFPALPLLEEKEKVLFDAIRTGGRLGIGYDLSKGRLPRSPDGIMQMKKKKADCDELSLLFISALKQLLEKRNKGTETRSDQNRIVFDPERYAAVLVVFRIKGKLIGHLPIFRKTDDTLLDLTRTNPQNLSGPPTKETLEFYEEEIVSVTIFDNINAFAAAHYREKGAYYGERVTIGWHWRLSRRHIY